HDVTGDGYDDMVMQLLASGDFNDGNVTGGYAGGIGIDMGIVFSTGRVSNINGPGEVAQESRTHGAEGPNDALDERFRNYGLGTAERVWFPGQSGFGDPAS